MLSQEQQQVSASTRFRFKQAGRTNQLKSFLEFKKQFENALDTTQISQLKQIYQHAVIGRNSHLQTVVVDRLGLLKLSDVNKIVDDEMLYAYFCQRLLHISENLLKEKEQIIWVVDLSGKIMQLASKRIYAILDKFLENAQKYFPGLLARLYFINTPMLFDTIWNKVSNKLSNHTLAKVAFLTDDLEELYHEVDPSILPECLGGDCNNQTIFLAQDSHDGKWKKQQMELKDEEEDEEEQEIDMSSLKAALSGLKLGGNNQPSVANTPLNTEADDYKKK